MVITIGMGLYMRRVIDDRTGELRGLVKLLENQLEDANKRLEEGYLAKLDVKQISSIGRQINELVIELLLQLGMVDQLTAHHYRVGIEQKKGVFGGKADSDGMRSSVDEIGIEKVKSVVEQMESSKARVHTNLKKTVKTLEDFRDICNVAFNDERRAINLNEYIDKTTSIMQYELIKKNCQIKLDVSNQMVETYPGSFSMMVIQMMMASAFYGKDGEIRISSGFDEERFFLVYHDNRMLVTEQVFNDMIKATNILEEDLDPAIFHFQMMHYLVTKKLGGKIGLESRSERGTDINIMLPR